MNNFIVSPFLSVRVHFFFNHCVMFFPFVHFFYHCFMFFSLFIFLSFYNCFKLCSLRSLVYHYFMAFSLCLVFLSPLFHVLFPLRSSLLSTLFMFQRFFFFYYFLIFFILFCSVSRLFPSITTLNLFS